MSSPRLRVTRASRHGARLVPLPSDLAATLRVHRPPDAAADALVFPGRDGAPPGVGGLRRRVLAPAAERAGLPGVGFHTLHHMCASLLIESGMNVLRLQRRMGQHSPAFTLETYGQLLDGDLGPPLDLHTELGAARAR
jgi:integrase